MCSENQVEASQVYQEDLSVKNKEEIEHSRKTKIYKEHRKYLRQVLKFLKAIIQKWGNQIF